MARRIEPQEMTFGTLMNIRRAEGRTATRAEIMDLQYGSGNRWKCRGRD